MKITLTQKKEHFNITLLPQTTLWWTHQTSFSEYRKAVYLIWLKTSENRKQWIPEVQFIFPESHTDLKGFCKNPKHYKIDLNELWKRWELEKNFIGIFWSNLHMVFWHFLWYNILGDVVTIFKKYPSVLTGVCFKWVNLRENIWALCIRKMKLHVCYIWVSVLNGHSKNKVPL